MFLLKIKPATKQLRHCSLGVKSLNASTISRGSLLKLLFFLKICQMLICPVRGTYNHVWIFLCSRKKKAFKLANGTTFSITKSLYMFHFFSQMVICTISGTSLSPHSKNTLVKISGLNVKDPKITPIGVNFLFLVKFPGYFFISG